MSCLIFNKKGITLVEVMVAVFLTMVAVISLMSMFPLAMQTSTKSDYMGRAVGILQKELEFREDQVMRRFVPAADTTYDQNIQVSGLASKEGDASLVLKTIMTKQGTNSWLINVQVTWAGNSTGIKNSIIVTPQMNFM